MDPFEDPEFVQRFDSRRLQHDSVNACVDEPAILERLRLISPHAALEFGCATGMLTSRLLECCESVVAVDRSAHMIEQAKSRVVDHRVSFLCADFQDFRAPHLFDVVVSGMAMHLVPDLSEVVATAYSCLRDGGKFIFTQRHPIRTANPKGEQTLDGKASWSVSDYFSSGRRDYDWLGTPVNCYHRSIEQIVSECRHVGFRIEEVAEPQPQTDTKSARVTENFSSPSVLLIHATK